MKIEKENVLVVAGLVWFIAGANVANLGVHAIMGLDAVPVPEIAALTVGGLAVFGAFHMMFGKLVKKNTARIRALDGTRLNPLRFMDVRGYLMMGFMMSFGFGLRAAGLVPAWFVAFFYTGLGLALALAGAAFLAHRVQGEGWSFHKRGQEA